ncbi:MAG: hypothetical protein S4CHLAM45_01860 [Chlamydiales bacterium]|nr:hypothetical protein [Chlamydiales bacterium]MCH9619505.1 hypothetical protein [Chlamydiales bacterium]MCH9622309.1 hypothetical protein [Chlamydiales bacterium]
MQKDRQCHDYYGLPKNCDLLSFQAKIDWHIEHYYKEAIIFIEDWLDYIESDDNEIEIHLTTFEEMAQSNFLIRF